MSLPDEPAFPTNCYQDTVKMDPQRLPQTIPVRYLYIPIEPADHQDHPHHPDCSNHMTDDCQPAYHLL